MIFFLLVFCWTIESEKKQLPQKALKLDFTEHSPLQDFDVPSVTIKVNVIFYPGWICICNPKLCGIIMDVFVCMYLFKKYQMGFAPNIYTLRKFGLPQIFYNWLKYLLLLFWTEQNRQGIFTLKLETEFEDIDVLCSLRCRFSLKTNVALDSLHKQKKTAKTWKKHCGKTDTSPLLISRYYLHSLQLLAI